MNCSRCVSVAQVLLLTLFAVVAVWNQPDRCRASVASSFSWYPGETESPRTMISPTVPGSTSSPLSSTTRKRVSLALEKGESSATKVTIAGLLFVAATLATEVPRVGKRSWLMTANARMRANFRADAQRGVLTWPMAQLHGTPPAT